MKHRQDRPEGLPPPSSDPPPRKQRLTADTLELELSGRRRIAVGTSPVPHRRLPRPRSVAPVSRRGHCPGLVVGSRYHLIEVVGEGAAGTVYRARHLVTDRECALKFISETSQLESRMVARLEREAFAAARLDHPNCIRLYDAGWTDDGCTYLVMEFLSGRSLADELVACGHIAIDRALAITRQILAGIEHAHSASVIHRDLKPENVYLAAAAGDGPDCVKVLDFGIAKLMGSALDEAGGEELTSAGIALGTPHYMSPEQIRGKPLDGRSDLYSVAIILFEMICGRAPYDDAMSYRVAAQHLRSPIPPLSSFMSGRHDVPAELDDLLIRGMAKERSRRFGSAAEFRAALDEVVTVWRQRQATT